MTERQSQHRTYLMCRPDHFTVSYRINPWMDPDAPTDQSLAFSQWNTLKKTFEGLGHTVELVDPLEGYPDMVFAANGGFTLDGKAYGAKFMYPERQAEGPAYMRWFGERGFEVLDPREVNEGEGDLMLSGERILAGTGFRTDVRSHDEVRELFGREVVTLNLINPNYYHLDTAIAILDPIEGTPNANIAYVESAFDEPSLVKLRELYPEAIIVSDEDASVLGLNSISDGYNVVIAKRAVGFERQLRERGYNPIGVDLSELLLSGGGVKCCTLELRRDAK